MGVAKLWKWKKQQPGSTQHFANPRFKAQPGTF